MSTVADERQHSWAMLEYLRRLVGIFRSVWCARGAVVVENLLLRQQRMVLTRPTRRPPRLRGRDTRFWLLARFARREWCRHLVLVRPETVVRWHRAGWRLFWSWTSRRRQGRPRRSPEVRELIATMARDNPRWGSERGYRHFFRQNPR